MKDESRRAPSKKQFRTLSINERCDSIRSVLTANNFSENLWYHPLNSWLEYYGVSLTYYQRFIPDNRLRNKSRKTKSPVVSSESEVESEAEAKVESEGTERATSRFLNLQHLNLRESDKKIE